MMIFQPRAKKHTRFPVPIELFIVVLGTAVSYFADFNGNFGIKIVGNIDTG